MQSRRLVWIDALRVIVVMLIFAFHSARVFDSFEMFYAKSPQTSPLLSWGIVSFFSFWQMPLLFLLAGMSSYFALGKRSGGQYLKERSTRLLVPFVFGCLFVVPPQGWYGARTNAGYTGSLVQFHRDYFSLKWGAISDYLGGPSFGHLWFILFLYIVSIAAIPFFIWVRQGKGQAAGARMAQALAKPQWWILVALALLLSTGLPDLGGHNPFTFLVWFILGFLLASDDAPIQAARKWRWWLLGTGIVLLVPVVATYNVRERFPDPSMPIALNELGVQMTGWLLCLAAIGLAVAYLDRPWRGLAYLAEASYPTYILHQTVIVAIGFYLVSVLPQPLLSWMILTAASIAVTYTLYELLVRRWRLMRFLFGMKSKPREIEIS